MCDWISVKDKLPDYGEIVIVWDDIESELCTGMRVEERDGWKVEWVTSYWSGTHCSTDYYGRTDITHWMPLLEPPKRQGNQ